MRFRQRSSVDLPHPDGPMSAVTACGGMCRFTPASAVSLPYVTDTSRRSNVPRRGVAL